jgi:hypothetical protein
LDHEVHERDQIRAVAIARHVRLGEGQGAAQQGASEHAGVMHMETGLWTGVGAAEDALAAMRKGDGKLARLDTSGKGEY